MRPRLTAAALLIGTACGSPTDPTSGLRVVTENSSLRIENDFGRRTFYFIYERTAAVVLTWAPCVDPSSCASLRAGGETTIPYRAIGGYSPGKTEAIVWWWLAVPGPAGKSVPGRIHSVVVRL